MSDSDHDKTKRQNPRWLDLTRRILSIPLTILVLIYFLLEDLFLGILRPIFRLLGALSPLVALSAWLKRLPPYVALVVFAVPFILLEPVKVFSIFWISVGHFVSGAMLLIGSYILSLLIVERMFHVTRDQLLSIAWFAWCFRLVMRVKAWAFERLESTTIWKAVKPLGHQIAAAVRAACAWFYGWVSRVVQSSR